MREYLESSASFGCVLPELDCAITPVLNPVLAREKTLLSTVGLPSCSRSSLDIQLAFSNTDSFGNQVEDLDQIFMCYTTCFAFYKMAPVYDVQEEAASEHAYYSPWQNLLRTSHTLAAERAIASLPSKLVAAEQGCPSSFCPWSTAS